MKRISAVLLAFAVLFTMFACSYSDPVLDSIPAYKNKEFYSCGGIQDYTDYGKYTYEDITEEDLEASEYFSKVTPNDITEILLHLENFEGWVDTVGDEVLANYDFDKSTISENDYFYIKTKYGQPLGQSSTYRKFDFYSLYYFDIETQTLYYFHNNI